MNFQKIKNFYTLPVILLLVFHTSSLMFYHSDDYNFIDFGLNIQKHLDFYFNWSGRIVSTLVASILDGVFPIWFSAALNSLGITLLIYFIVMIGGNGKSYKNIQVSFLIIFVIYWIANPSLGQTTFWFVGSATYMWSNLFIVSFIYYIFNKSKSKFLIVILGFFAGCSNENTAPVYLVMIWLYTFGFANNGEKYSLRYYAIASMMVGMLALILAPGNFVRASHGLALPWFTDGFFHMLLKHLYDRLPYGLYVTWHAHFALLIFTFIAINNKRTSANSYGYSFAFFLGSIAASLIMFLSPGYPIRVHNGALVLILLSISMQLKPALESFSLKNTWLASIMSIYFIFALAYFIPSYYLFNKMMYSLNKQYEIRDSIARSAFEKGGKEITVPAFYFERLVKDSDRVDTFHNAGDMARFYGLESVRLGKANFNYGSLNNLQKIYEPVTYGDEKQLLGVWLNNIGKNKKEIILGFNSDIFASSNNNYKLFLRLYLKDKPRNLYGQTNNDPTVLGGLYYYNFIAEDFDISAIKGINFGLIDNKSGDIDNLFDSNNTQ